MIESIVTTCLFTLDIQNYESAHIVKFSKWIIQCTRSTLNPTHNIEGKKDI